MTTQTLAEDRVVISFNECPLEVTGLYLEADDCGPAVFDVYDVTLDGVSVRELLCALPFRYGPGDCLDEIARRARDVHEQRLYRRG